jgi:elongator complex protein 3
MLEPKSGEVRKPTKTISGITPVAVMLPPHKCKHGNCLYCPNLNVPQSYTPKSPVVMRASAVNYDSCKQVKARLKAFEVMNHPTEKVEIIIMGGTFLEYPEKFQYDFIKGIYDGLNGKISKNLKESQELNENSEHRCVALCIETRPDVCCEFIERIREFGCTRVELGVQILDNDIYEKVKRGHRVEDVIKATKCLRNTGFKIGYHIMPGLPGSNLKKDLKLFKKIFSDERFKPDQLKIYPCQVMPGSELEKIYWKGEYKPYSKEKIEKVLVKMLKVVPRYCRVMRVMREIPPEYLVAGTIKIDLRKDIEEELRKKNSKIKEIRYREIGFALRDGKKINEDLKLKITKYKASGGDEYFLEIVNSEDILFGLLRLRIFDNQAIIREVHVYGKSLKLGEKGNLSQHLGLGKKLMKKAEEIVERNKIKKISVISGIGVREYYKKLGYDLEKDKKEFMVKFL